MTLESLTAAECVRHSRALEKIRQRLFSRYAPADYFILPGSEQRLAAYAENCWNAACGDYRVVHWEGLSYVVDCADAAGSCEFSVSHAEGSGFHFWLKAAKGHTLCSVSVRFHKLDEIPHSYVQSYRRPNVTQIYGGGAG